jgi:D-lactate dehydrogenase
MPGDNPDLLATLRSIAGRRHVLTGPRKTRRYRTGYRYGDGPVLAVVRPGTPLEQYRAFEACVNAGAIVIVQAANTGLTGGSTPDGDYDRPVVIISTLRIARMFLVRDGQQVICLAGATLYDLEKRLAAIGREPHSVIGSSCIGASVVGGVCNNSGGALVRRGPAYTEYALYARVDNTGKVELINHLGLAADGDVEALLTRLGEGSFRDEDVSDLGRVASCREYDAKVRDVEAATPARFNADPDRLFEASGSAGKVMVLAVRLDTFPQDSEVATFYIGSNDPSELEQIRREMLSCFANLPVSGEYIHREAFDVAAEYGKDVFLAIERFGTDRLPVLFAIKNWVDGMFPWSILGRSPSDRLLQFMSGLFPQHLPQRMIEWRDRFEHHLIVKMAGAGVEEARRFFAELFPSSDGDMFECAPSEAKKAFLHRFAVAGAAIRYKAIHAEEVGGLVALDIALRRNDRDWFEKLPDDVRSSLRLSLYYGHFFCHVFHQDYVTERGVDPVALEHRMWEILDMRGAEYPAEHNVGHLYPASEALKQHYRALDPCNALNPGIGQTSRAANWSDSARWNGVANR